MVGPTYHVPHDLPDERERESVSVWEAESAMEPNFVEKYTWFSERGVDHRAWVSETDVWVPHG